MKELFTAIILDFFSFLRQEKDFLDANIHNKKTMLEKANIFPESFYGYFSSSDGDKFMQDFRIIFQSKKSFSDLRINSMDASFFKAMAEFFMNELPLYVDQNVPVSFNGYFGEALKNILESSSYYEISSFVQNYLQKHFSGKVVVVESPDEIPSSLKTDIRSHLNRKYPFSFAIFKLNKNLLGGLRIFVDGSMYDFSWLLKIKKIFMAVSLTH